MKEVEEAAAAKTIAKIERKKDLKVSKNIRNTERSKKAELLIKTEKVVKTPYEVLQMR